MLPQRIPKKPKRSTRWRSQAHCNFVRQHACTNCASVAGIEVAHVRKGSGAGMGQKPDDWNTVSLCRECHQMQHSLGEDTFWGDRDPRAVIASFCQASPKRHEIQAEKRERGIA